MFSKKNGAASVKSESATNRKRPRSKKRKVPGCIKSETLQDNRLAKLGELFYAGKLNI